MRIQRKQASLRLRGVRDQAGRDGTQHDRVAYLIENLRRRHEWYRTLDAQDQALYDVKPRKSSLPGLGLGEVEFLRRHAIQEFLHHAKLGRDEMLLLEEHLHHPLTEGRKDELILLLAKSYSSSITWATGGYADLLTQALLSRSERTRLAEKTRMAICSEAIQFADSLSTPGLHASWEDNTQAPTFPIGTAPVQERERVFFWERMRIYRSDWSREAYRRITVRFLLAGGRELSVRTSPFRRRVARLVFRMQEAADHEICLEMDRQNERAFNEKRESVFPVPPSLEHSGVRLWAEPFEKNQSALIQDIHELLSKIRNEFGLRRADPRPNPPPFPQKA